MKHISFPSIEQYRNVVHNVIYNATYVGKDQNGNVVHDSTRPLPTLTFQGTVKCHGTNAAVAVDAGGNMWCQSRENIITVEKDNAGFAMFVQAHKPVFERLLHHAIATADGLKSDETILIFGEFAGGNIQKNVALTQLPKTFIVFGIAHVDANNQRRWFTDLEITEVMFENTILNVFHIYQFPHYTIDIDFNRPHDVQNVLSDMTLDVERECPVGKQLGATAEKGSTTGEGIVWRCINEGYRDSGYWFKVKGAAHSAKTKVKTLAQVDVQRIDSINELGATLTPIWRLEQMFQQTFDTLNGGNPDIKGTGLFIKNVMSDVLKEEIDTIAASGFTTKEITGPISRIARDYLMDQLNASVGLN